MSQNNSLDKYFSPTTKKRSNSDMDTTSPAGSPLAKRQDPRERDTVQGSPTKETNDLKEDKDRQPNTNKDTKKKDLVTMEHFDTQMSEMETRLTSNITASVTAGLRAIIDSSVKEALETIKNSVDEAIESHPTIKTHSEQLDSLETENILLKSKVSAMEGEAEKAENKARPN